jgi:ATP-dependent DNA helicase RecG
MDVFFIRIGDTCHPFLGDDVLRLALERADNVWEESTSLDIQIDSANKQKVFDFCTRIRTSNRVSQSILEKTDNELLTHYALVKNGILTNLGVLFISEPHDRRRLSSAPIVQAIKYDESGVKIAKWCWDDNELSPIEIIDDIWNTIPDFREGYEVPNGMLRRKIPAYELQVIRELLVNAFAHRPYTQRGDIFLNIYSNRLEVVNPGRLPIGITPKNILHLCRRRNDNFAHILHDMGYMEREGSGIDMIYERLLITGRSMPKIVEKYDSVHVTVQRRVLRHDIVLLLNNVDKYFSFTHRERITFALIVQKEVVSLTELIECLNLLNEDETKSWLGRLVAWGLVEKINNNPVVYSLPERLHNISESDTLTNIIKINHNYLCSLIYDTIRNYPESTRHEIRNLLGLEIPIRAFKNAFKDVMGAGCIDVTGATRSRKFHIKLGSTNIFITVN